MAEEGSHRRRKLAAILMADVAGFSRLMGEDEERTTARIQEFHRRVEGVVRKHQGRVVDTAGDSVFGEFDSVVNAMRCAHQIQEQQAALNRGLAADERVETRIGVHLGDVIVEDYRVFGDGVNIAARLESQAEPGGICISEAVYQQVHGKLDFGFEDLGLRELKNIRYPLRLYRVVPPGGEPVPTAAVQVAARSRRLARRRRRMHPAPTPSPGPVAERSWGADLTQPAVLVPSVVGVGLVLSPTLLFPSGGIFPTGGAILLAVILGRVWARRSGRPGNKTIALGAGIASGAIFTAWSPFTNALFVLAGLIVASFGLRPGPPPRDRGH